MELVNTSYQAHDIAKYLKVKMSSIAKEAAIRNGANQTITLHATESKTKRQDLAG